MSGEAGIINPEKIAARITASAKVWLASASAPSRLPARRARYGRGTAAAHAARSGMLHEHHPGKCERHAGERVGAEPADEKTVERDESHDRQQVEHVRCR